MHCTGSFKDLKQALYDTSGCVNILIQGPGPAAAPHELWSELSACEMWHELSNEL